MTSRESSRLAVLSIADTPADAMWPMPLDVEYIDGRRWKLAHEFFFHSPREAVFPSVYLPTGFVTDFASIPRFFWRIIYPTDQIIGKAAVIHDFFYNSPSIQVTRLQADQMLRAGMEALGAPKWERELCYRLIRIFGRGFVPRLT